MTSIQGHAGLLLLTSGTVVTWNPSDKNSNLSLSGGSLVVTLGSGGAWCALRATLGLSAVTANNYFEIVCGDAQQIIGVANTSAPITSSNYIGIDANGWAYYASNGKSVHSAVQTTYGVSAVSGDVIGILLKNGKLYFRKNGTWMNGADPIAQTGYAFTGLTGSLYPAMSLFTGATSATARFSYSSFTGTLPAGTSSWGGL